MGRRTVALLAAVLMGFMGVVFSSSTAHGAVINPVQADTLKAVKSGGSGQVHVGDTMEGSGNSPRASRTRATASPSPFRRDSRGSRTPPDFRSEAIPSGNA